MAEGQERQIRIIYFHDVLCPYCYVENSIVEKIISSEKVNIRHAVFPILPTLEHLKMFARTEKDARQFFLREFSIVKNFIPTYDPNKPISKGKITWIYSIPVLKAVKVAEFLGGQEAHWKYYITAQKLFFEEGENINDMNVLLNIAEEIRLDVEKFKKIYNSVLANDLVDDDMTLGMLYGVRGTPTFVFSTQHHDHVVQAYLDERRFMKILKILREKQE